MSATIAEALANPATSAAITTFAKGALATIVTAVLAPEIGSIIAVGGAYLAVGAAYYAWKQAQNDQLQALAMNKLCSSANPVPGCGSGFYVIAYSTNNRRYIRVPIYPNTTNPQQYYKYYVLDQKSKGINYGEEQYRYSLQTVFRSGVDYGYSNIDPTTLSEEPIDRKPWSEWTAEERESAIRNLSDADWSKVLSQIAPEGTLQPGQTLPSDVITLDNAQVQPAGTKVLTPEQQTLREAIKPELDKINSDLAKNAAAIAAITATLGFIGATTGNIDKNVANLGNTATQTKQAVDNVGAKVDAVKTEMNDKFNDLKKRTKNISLAINWDRLLLLMTWWQTLHNCMMLSADVSRSLVSSVETALAALPGDSLLGIPTEDPDGSPLDIGKFISTSFESFIKGAIGAESYAELKLDLAKINRIYQASSNLLSQVQSLTNDLQNIAELTGENTSRIGNALVRFGVVGENAYRAMDENMDTKTSFIHRLQNKLETAQSLAANLESIAQSVYSTEQTLVEIGNQSKEFKSAIKTVIPKSEADNTTVKKQQTIDKESSQSPTLSIDDLDKPHADNS